MIVLSLYVMFPHSRHDLPRLRFRRAWDASAMEQVVPRVLQAPCTASWIQGARTHVPCPAFAFSGRPACARVVSRLYCRGPADAVAIKFVVSWVLQAPCTPTWSSMPSEEAQCPWTCAPCCGGACNARQCRGSDSSPKVEMQITGATTKTPM